jgi:hypothetical protein
MKKVFFVLAAAVVMGMTLVACGEKKAAQEAAEEQVSEEIVIDETMDPGEQLQALTMQFGDFLKAAHINNQEEADAFLAKTLSFKEAIEKVSMDMQKKMESLEGDEQTAYAAAMIEIANGNEEFKKLVAEETARLKAEAEKAGASIEDFDK